MKNALQTRNEAKAQELIALRDSTRKTAQTRTLPKYSEYLLEDLRLQLVQALQAKFPTITDTSRIEVGIIDRARFSADITMRVPHLLKELGVPAYIAQVQPSIVDICKNLSPVFGFEETTTVGLYVNIRIADANFWTTWLSPVLALNHTYGQSDAGSLLPIISEYSSPNAAKHLHAGHIRSTIIGNAVSNLLESVGYLVYRMNFVNDFGGMGVIITGYRQFASLPSFVSLQGNGLLYAIYSLYRSAEKAAASETAFAEVSTENRALFQEAFGESTNFSAFASAFKAFKAEADKAFRQLEAGEGETVALWETLVGWSMEEFDEFYAKLGVSIPFVTPESFFASPGQELVKRFEGHGITFWTQNHADAFTQKITAEVATGSLKTEVAERLIAEATADIGSYVVELDNNERYVVLKADGSTIYATRDMAMIAYRMQEFAPTRILHEVGQEQHEHFDKLFRSARTLKIVPESVETTHIYHGFYVNEQNKKLSSRDGASNVLALIDASIAYFKAKYLAKDDHGFSEEEITHASKALGIGSITFNDLKKDKKSNVTFLSNTQALLAQFEESGGAYVVYSSCRAKSIVRKAGGNVPTLDPNQTYETEAEEIALIKKLVEYPYVALRAAESYNPTTITEYLLSLAQSYNTYYAKYPVITNDTPLPHRLVLTASVAQVLDNGLRLLGIMPLDRI